MKGHPRVLFAGQICGVEGYVESIATGLIAGIHASAIDAGSQPVAPPRASAFGSLTHYVTHADPKNFQPANITFDLLPALENKIRDRKERHRVQCEFALRQFDEWMERTRMLAAAGGGPRYHKESAWLVRFKFDWRNPMTPQRSPGCSTNPSWSIRLSTQIKVLLRQLP